jgi:protein ImuA
MHVRWHLEQIMNNVLPSRPALLRAIARIERTTLGHAAPAAMVALGHRGIDEALGGGLMRGRVHEVFATEGQDSSSAAGFAAMVAHRLGGGIVWLRQREAEQRGGALHAHGLAAIGIDPRTLILALPPDPKALLRAAAEVVRCPEVGVAVIELWRSSNTLDLTASRRLALAAESSGVTALVLRIDAEAAPSAAQTRWSVRAATSTALEAGAPGHPSLEISLLRQRGRPAVGCWQVEWNRDRAKFSDRHDDRDAAAASGAVFPIPDVRPATG